MSAALDFTYQYAFASGVAALPSGRPQLSLATCDAEQKRAYFFEGRARQPRILGEMLYTLSDVVRTHFFLPRPALLDPVLTSNEDMLRLEGFSGCCGVYARVDLPAGAFDGECHGRGTTNVDFNAPMRNALLRLRDGEDVEFAVGADEVALSHRRQCPNRLRACSIRRMNRRWPDEEHRSRCHPLEYNSWADDWSPVSALHGACR
jgi:hypothetical protein